MFPTQVSAVINRFSELSGEFRIVLTTSPPFDYLPLELEQSSLSTAESSLVQMIESEIKEQLGITARVQLTPPDFLPKTQGKTIRVIRQY